MKKITLLLLSVLFIATYSLQAQKQFAGEIQFQTKLEGTDDPNLSSSIPNQTMNTSILGNKVKTVINIQEMYVVTNIWDGDKGTAAFVIELMGMGKFYKKWNVEEYKEKVKFNDYSYRYENEFKEVCGYKCQKAMATVTNLEDDSSSEFIMYVTKEIGTGKLNGAEFPDMEGYPLITMTPIEQYCDECYMVIEATKITPKKIKEVDFLLPDDAKNIDENPELKEMLKGVFGEE